ncbi:MAG: DUF4230 domain-containing protein [Anaerolineaceae bacterium]|nr:DUF4230 domain-containing protein [Anaerolineaceae bacterium]
MPEKNRKGLSSNESTGFAKKALWFGSGFVLLIILLFILLFLFLSRTIKNTTDIVFEPIQEVNAQWQTEVASIIHPTPTIIPDPISIIHEVRSIARLETIQYSVEKVVTAESGEGLFGDKLLFVAHGVVIAGVDLEKIKSDDLWVEGQVLFIRLPEPQIFITTLDNDKSYVYDRETGLLTKGNKDLETLARQTAEDEIEKAAIEDGIINLAKINAENYLSRLLRNFGFEEVFFEYSTSLEIKSD